MIKEESVATANEKVLNKVNPNEFDPLQEKEKKAEEIKKEPNNQHGDVSAKEPTSVPPAAVSAAKTSTSQINEYYGATPVYGLYSSIII